MTRVDIFIIDARTVVRAGWQTLLARTPELRVVGEATGMGDATPIFEVEAADVVVVGLPAGGNSQMEVGSQLRRWLAIGGDDHPAAWHATLAAGAAGYVREDAEDEYLVAALREVARGARLWTAAQLEAVRKWRAEAYGRWEDMSEREREVLGWAVRGSSNQEIAESLQLSERTVENHLSHALAKLGLHSRSQAASWLIENGFWCLCASKSRMTSAVSHPKTPPKNEY